MILLHWPFPIYPIEYDSDMNGLGLLGLTVSWFRASAIYHSSELLLYVRVMTG